MKIETHFKKILEYRLKNMEDNLFNDKDLYKYSAKFLEFVGHSSDVLGKSIRSEYIRKYNELIKRRIDREK